MLAPWRRRALVNSVMEAANGKQVFDPFYWRILRRKRNSISHHSGVAFALALAFIIPHFASTQWSMFNDLSWMLGLLIFSATFLLYYATAVLFDLIQEVDERIPAQHRELYMGPLASWLSDSKFIAVGLFFSILNCIVGQLFGVSYANLPSKVTIYWGFAVVGFVSGIAAYGVVGVIAFSQGFVKAAPSLDYRDPDRCGGTSFFGAALVKFSAINLIMGVLISFYIVYAPWTDRKNPLVHALMWVWIGLPFAVSLAHLLLPGSVIHSFLSRFKKQTQTVLSKQIKATRAQVQTHSNVRTTREDLEYELKLQAELYKMNTWPFSIESLVHYVTVLLAETIPACVEGFKLFREH